MSPDLLAEGYLTVRQLSILVWCPQALVLMRLGEQGERVGLIAGGTTSALMLAVSIKRAIDTGE